MLTLTEQYIIDEFKFSDLYKSNKERGKRWGDKSVSKSFGKAYGKALYKSSKSGKPEKVEINRDKTIAKANRAAFVGKHIGQVGGAAGAAGLAGAAYLAYKLYKKWKNKEKEADTPEEKELFRKKADAAKAKSQKLKTKKG